MSTTVTVADEQVQPARARVEIAGGADEVDPPIAEIAAAAPRGAAAEHRAS